jgi:hypothetical protein
MFKTYVLFCQAGRRAAATAAGPGQHAPPAHLDAGADRGFSGDPGSGTTMGQLAVFAMEAVGVGFRVAIASSGVRSGPFTPGERQAIVTFQLFDETTTSQSF